MSVRSRMGSCVLLCGVLAGCASPPASDDALVASAEPLQQQSEGDWRMAAFDSAGTGHNPHEKLLKPSNVDRLEVKWVFDEAVAGEPVAPIHANPVIAGGITYVGSYAGRFYAIGAQGELLWQFDTEAPGPLFQLFFGNRAPIIGAAVLPAHEASVVFGDTDGRIYKLDRASGALLWSVDLDAHDLGGIWGNSLMIEGDTVYVGIASFETLAPFFPDRTCCSHRGALAAVDLASGETKWRYEVIPEAAQGAFSPELIEALGGFESFGPSGGDIWSQPTYDARTQTVFASTGQLFSRAPDGSGPAQHDAVIAVDALTGLEKWATHLSDNVDVYRFDIAFFDEASGEHFDKDVSDQPKLYKLNGRYVVGAGQKDGRYHVLDAASGAVVASTQHVDMITAEGGLQSGGAVAGKRAFQHGVMSPADPTAPYDGVVLGLSLDGRDVEWELALPASPLFGSLAVANGVLFFQSPFEEGVGSEGAPPTWALYAVDAKDGTVLKRMPFANARALNGPAVSRGRVYAGFGSAFTFGLATPVTQGGVVCVGLPDAP